MGYSLPVALFLSVSLVVSLGVMACAFRFLGWTKNERRESQRWFVEQHVRLEDYRTKLEQANKDVRVIDYDGLAEILIDVQPKDTDICLRFPGGKEISLVCRPSEAKPGFAGSFTMFMPRDWLIATYTQSEIDHGDPLSADDLAFKAMAIVAELPMERPKAQVEEPKTV